MHKILVGGQLYLAMKGGHHDVIEEILDHKQEVNIQDKWGSTALHMYSSDKKGSVGLVKKLLQLGADPGIMNSDKRTCLHVAALEGKADVVACLLDQDLSTNESKEKVLDVNAVDRYDSTALHLAAAVRNDDVLEVILDHRPNLHIQNRSDETALMIYLRQAEAAAHVVRKFLQNLVNPNMDGNDPDLGATGCDEGLMKELLKHGPDPEVPSREHAMPLHLVAANGSDVLLGALLDYLPRMSVNVQDIRGQTPLMLYIGRKNAAAEYVVRKLVQHGADLRIVDKKGQNCLHVAASGGYVETVRILLHLNAICSLEKRFDINSVDETGFTPLHLAVRKFEAAGEFPSHHALETVNMLIQHGANPQIVDKQGRNILHTAAFNSHDEVVRGLLEHEMSISLEKRLDVNAVDEEGSTALHLAVSGNLHTFQENMVKTLLEHGANPWVLDKRRRNVLHVATLNMSGVDVMRSLLNHELCSSSQKYLHINAVDEDGSTALHFAVDGSIGASPIIVREFLQYGANPQIQDKQGRNALHVATLNGTDVEVMRSLLEYGTCSNTEKHLYINAVDKDGSTALHHLAVDRYIAASAIILRELLEHGANPQIPNQQGQNVLHVAAFGGNHEVVKSLLTHDVSCSSHLHLDINAVDKDGSTALHLAVCGSIRASPVTIRELLEHGANPRIRDKHGRNVLHVAASFHWSDVEVMRRLLMHKMGGSPEKHLDINAVDEDASTVLHLAAGNDTPSRNDVMNVLLDHGPNVNVQNVSGHTPLKVYIESAGSSVRVVERFIEQGAHVDLDTLDRIEDLKRANQIKFISGVHVFHSDTDHLEVSRTHHHDSFMDSIFPDSVTGYREITEEVLDELEVISLSKVVNTEDEFEVVSTDFVANSWSSKVQNLHSQDDGGPVHVAKRLRILPAEYESGISNAANKESFSDSDIEITHEASSSSFYENLAVSSDSRYSRRSIRSDAVAFGFKGFDETFDSRRVLFVHFQSSEDDGAVEIFFLHQEGMALLFGVGVLFSKILLRPGCDIEVIEVGKADWTQIWTASEIQMGSLAVFDATVPIRPVLSSSLQTAEYSTRTKDVTQAAVDVQQEDDAQHLHHLRSFQFKASQGSSGATNSNTDGNAVSRDRYYVPTGVNHSILEDSMDIGDDLQKFFEVTVKIRLNPDDFTFYPEGSMQIDTSNGISEHKMLPIVTITFYKQRYGDHIFKRFKTTLDLNFFMDGDVDNPYRFGWCQDELRLSFKCMEPNAVTIESRSEYLDVDERNHQQVQGHDKTISSLKGKGFSAKFQAGTNQVASGEIGANMTRESTVTNTDRQENLTSSVQSCLKQTNFAIDRKGGPVELACVAFAMPAIHDYDLWNPVDRRRAYLSGMMSRVPIVAEGDWSVTSNVHTTERSCEYQFTSQRNLIMFQKVEVPPTKPSKFLDFSRSKIIKETVVETSTIKQQLIKIFLINHSFSHLESLRKSERHYWDMAITPEAPARISKLIRISSSSGVP